MANGLYDAARESFLNADIDWSVDDIRAGARIAVSAALGSKTSAAGVADAADVTFSAVSGATVEAVVLYKHTGVESTSNLIAYMDTGMTGLPVTPNGGDITVQWASTTNRIFKL